MNTDVMKRFKSLSNENLMHIAGGWSGLGDILQGILGGFAPSPTVDQLNGKWPVRNPPKPCSPYGTGGTPNACNGF